MRLLVVEDHDDLRASIAWKLRGQGYAVDEAESLLAADQLAEVYEYAAIVLDRLLDDGDGVDWLRERRRRGDTTPVLLLTALDEVADRVEGLEAGADDYLVKPFAMAELRARIAAMVRRRTRSRPVVLRCGDLEVDTGRREVRRRGTLLTLRPKEFAVLELLASRAGETVRRQEILESGWDEHHEPLSNVEEVLVASLRRKLGKPPLITTVRGAGYRLDPAGGDG